MQKIIDTDEKLGWVEIAFWLAAEPRDHFWLVNRFSTPLEHLHSIKTDKRVTNIPESYLKEDELKVALFRRQNQKGNQTIVNEQFNKEFLEYWKKIRKIFISKFLFDKWVIKKGNPTRENLRRLSLKML